MRVTIKHIQDLIQSAKLAGADKKHLALLENCLEEKQALSSRSDKSNATSYTSESVDDRGRKVVFYSTAPLSDDDKSYFD
jgi:hypothetical protein